LYYSYRPTVPQAEQKTLFRQAWKKAGAPARCPRLAIGHTLYDPTLVKDNAGQFYLRATAQSVRALFAPRKSVEAPGASVVYAFQLIALGALMITVNGYPTFLDVDGKIEIKRFGPGHLEDEQGNLITIEADGHTAQLTENASYYFFRM